MSTKAGKKHVSELNNNLAKNCGFLSKIKTPPSNKTIIIAVQYITIAILKLLYLHMSKVNNLRINNYYT